MSGIAAEDHPTNPEAEQLLSSHVRGDSTPSAHVRVQSATAESWRGTHLREDDTSSSSKTTNSSRNKSAGASRSAEQQFPGDATGGDDAPTPSPSIIVNSVLESDDHPPPYMAHPPPPYSAIAPSDHLGWPFSPYGLSSYDDSHLADCAPPYSVEIPLASYQDPGAPPPAFSLEGVDGQQRYVSSVPTTVPSTSSRLFKFGCRRSSGETWLPSNVIDEKIDERKSRRYGAILAAAAVIISLMALSLMVRFVMKRSWWRG